jgi:hypothetical protein
MWLWGLDKKKCSFLAVPKDLRDIQFKYLEGPGIVLGSYAYEQDNISGILICLGI